MGSEGDLRSVGLRSMVRREPFQRKLSLAGARRIRAPDVY